MTRTSLLGANGNYLGPIDSGEVNAVETARTEMIPLEELSLNALDARGLDAPGAAWIPPPVLAENSGSGSGSGSLDLDGSYASYLALRSLVDQQGDVSREFSAQRNAAIAPSMAQRLAARGIDPQILSDVSAEEQERVEHNTLGNAAQGYGMARFLAQRGAETTTVLPPTSDALLPPSRGTLVRGADGVFRVAPETSTALVRSSERAVAETASTVSSAARGAELGVAGGAARALGRIAVPVALAVDAIDLGSSIKADADRGDGLNTETKHSVGRIAGGWGGAWAGAEVGAIVGASVGTVVPVVGNAVGGAAGAIIGGIVGAVGGSKIGEWVSGLF